MAATRLPRQGRRCHGQDTAASARRAELLRDRKDAGQWLGCGVTMSRVTAMRHARLRWLVFVVGICASGCAHPGYVPASKPRSTEWRINLNEHELTLHLSPGTPRASRRAAGLCDRRRRVARQGPRRVQAARSLGIRDHRVQRAGVPGPPARRRRDHDARKARIGLRHDHRGRPMDAASSRPPRRSFSSGCRAAQTSAVVAAGQPGLQPQLGGVVAMGLTREEEYVHRRRRSGRSARAVCIPAESR